MVTGSASPSTATEGPPGPLDDAGYAFLPPKVRAQLFVLPSLMRNPPDYFAQTARQYGGVVTLSPNRAYLVTDLDGIKHVLQDNHTNYIKGPWYHVLRPLMGDGLFSIDGEDWKRQRRLVQPAFQRKHHARMAGIMVDSTSRMLERWEGKAARAEAVDGRAEVILLTIEILLRNMFSGDLIGSEQVIRDAILDCSRHMNLIDAVRLVKVLTWFRFAKRRRFEHGVRTLDQFVLRVVEQRRRDKIDNGDLVSLLLWARDEQTGESMSDRQIRDELKTMLQAGNDTVADVICWTWYLLAKHAEIRERVEQEVDAVLNGRPPGFEDLPGLEYTRRVVMETMRLYPPGWVFARSALKDDVIGGFRIPAEALVIVSPYVMHRLPTLWEDPERFDPDRFLAERSIGRPRFAYFPFSAGPRQCIGADVAMMEAQMIVAMAAQRYRLSVPANLSPGLKARISLTADCAIELTPIARQTHLATQLPSKAV
jgi:cytochrome P450